MSEFQENEFINLLELELAADDLLEFTAKTMSGYRVNWHHRVLADALEDFAFNTDRRLMVFMPPRHGKALALDTPILTTKGWKQHGEIHPGDFVYHPSGKPNRVIAFSIPDDQDLYLEFGSGEVIACHENHEWRVYDAYRRQYRIIEAGQLYNLKKRISGKYRYFVNMYPLDKPLNPIVDAWIGDTVGGSCIQVESKDGLYVVGKSLLETHNSELVSRRYPAWRLGLDPSRRIVISSYSGRLASSFNRDIQRVMETRTYNEIFPETLIPQSYGLTSLERQGDSYLRNSSICEVVGTGGYLYTVGVGGTLTGYGADDLIIDDPHKGIEEAYSETLREKVWEWYTGTASTRLEKGGNILLCQTRWHTQDLAGKLLAEMENGGDFAEQWDIVSFPAIATEDVAAPDVRQPGEALWPWKYDVDRLNRIAARLGTTNWYSIFGQSPTVKGGKIIKETWFRYYDRLPETGTWAVSWDLSFGSKSKTASFVVGQVWLRSGTNYFLVWQYRSRLEFAETLTAIGRSLDEFPQIFDVLIEKKANGAAALNMLNVGSRQRLVAIEPGGDKEQRLHACSPLFEQGRVWLPKTAPWLKAYELELTTFPAAADDDQVDATSQMLNYWNNDAADIAIRPGSIERTAPWLR